MDLPGQTIPELLAHWAATDGDAEAFVAVSVDGERRAVSRRELRDLSTNFASLLRETGVRQGHVVCVSLPNSLERVVADFGTIVAGAAAQNGQIFRADGEDFVQALNSTQAYAIVLDPDAQHGAWEILKRFISSPTEEVQCQQLPHLRHIITCTRSQDLQRDFLSKLRMRGALPAASAMMPTVAPSDVAVIWTTSGSTGFSKLVPQMHSNLLHIMRQVQRISRLQSGEHFFNVSLLGWAAGFPLWFLGCGATRVFLDCFAGPPRDPPAAIWRCVQQERCAYAFITPMYVAAILQRKELWQRPGAWRPRGINMAGQPIKRVVVAAAGPEALCDAVDINYGTTECGVIATAHVTDPASYREGLTGPPAFGVDLRVVDGELRDVRQGETGEILARSPALYGSYVDNPPASRRSFTPDGWFRTDDVGHQLPDGSLVHLGRRSDAITRGTYLCYPAWLETLLSRAPGVADVCVVPVPDPVLHHEICACVVPTQKPPPPGFVDSLRDFADSLLLTSAGDAQHMAPKYYVICDKLACTPTGKVSRKDVTLTAVQQLGLESNSCGT